MQQKKISTFLVRIRHESHEVVKTLVIILNSHFLDVMKMWLLELVLYCVNVALNIISWFLQYFSLKKNVYEILLSSMISYTHILSHVPNEFIVMRSLHMIYYLHQTMRGRVERKLNWIPWIGGKKNCSTLRLFNLGSLCLSIDTILPA